MAGEWTSINLGRVCTKIGSGATPRGGRDVYLSSGPYALIRSQNVYNDGFHRDGLAFISERHASELSNVEVHKGDVLLNITGDSVARACQVDPRILPARVNQHVSIIRPDPNQLDPRFLRYFLVSPKMQAKLLSWAGAGGTRNALTKGMIESFDVRAPKDIDEQCAIAHILGTLDDKIELNRRMSETLEAMARTLFKSWFVDFDPVCAKAEERDPGLSALLVDVLPDSFVDAEFGQIPTGWDPAPFGTLVEHCRIQEDPGTSPDVLFSHYSIPAFDEGRWPRSEPGASIKSIKWRVAPGTILLSKLNPETDRVWLVDVQHGERAVCSTEFLVLRPRTPFTRAYIYCLTRSPAFRERLEAMATGTSNSHQRVRVSAILDLMVPLPPPRLVEAFDRAAESLLGRASICRRESHTLTLLRDVLLPKLVSGELRVREAERLVGLPV